MSRPRVLSGDAALDPAPAELGGKAANLVRLVRAGAPVPPWVVLPAWVHEDAPAATGDGPLDPELLREVQRALETAGLAESLLAVRSSAVGEDAAGASFAGQFETVLGVRADDAAGLASAISAVWRSASAERVRAYLGDPAADPPRMAVILQALVDAEAAGVAFSADPVTGDRAVAVVSAVHGLGETLVSGEEDGDSYRVGFSGAGGAAVLEARVATQTRALRRVGAATRWVDLDDAARTAPAITDTEAMEIAAVARGLASVLGGPQDVEWALEAPTPGTSGPLHARGAGLAAVPGPGAGPAPPLPQARRLVVLQARPITTLAGGERRIWDNSNIVESYAGVTTPLTFSFARAVYEDVYRQFCQVMGVSPGLIDANRDIFAHMLGLIRGRVYYNLLSWYRLLSLLPGYSFNRAFMERMMGVREKLTDPPEPQLVAGKWTDLLRLVRMVVRMVRSSRGLRHDVPAFHRRLDEALLPLADVDLGTWTSDDLLALYRRLEDDLLRHWHPPLVNDFFAMIWFGVLGRLVERWLPDEPPTLVNDLLAGEGGMISTEPARQVMALAGQVAASPALEALFAGHQDDNELLAALEDGGDGVQPFRQSVADYLRRFGDRCANELKLETITLSDEPDFLVATIRSYWRQGATDPDASRARESAIRASAEGRVHRRLGGLRRRAFNLVLRQARDRIRDRENLRFERTRVFGVVRRIFLGFGRALVRAGRLEQARDVFWLTTGEVFGWADGTAAAVDFRPVVTARRAEFATYETGPPPPERFETWGSPAESIPAAAATSRSANPSPGSAAGEGSGARGGTGAAGVLEGMGCCPGVVRAPVRLVRDPRQAGDLGGRILVAERTDPGWTLLFPSAAGILVQRGSLLSHSAIVAREMGIPCVVAVPGLMDALIDGEIVEMDGTSGTILRVGPGTKPEPSSDEVP
jgi:rifampicin phosphotransferase